MAEWLRRGLQILVCRFDSGPCLQLLISRKIASTPCDAARMDHHPAAIDKHRKTAPLRQPARTVAAELPGQHDLVAIPVGADDVRAQFARTAFIAADNLFFGEDCVAENGVGGARHGLHAEDGSCFVPRAMAETYPGIGTPDCVRCG